MKTVCLLYGPVAAGKSTWALRLAAERNAVRFVLDDWMHALFSADARQDIDMAWAMTRVARCREVIWATSLQVLAAGTDVVLEIGLMRADERALMRSRVEAAGHRAEFHFVDADLATRRERVARRNKERGATYSSEVTPRMFDAIERHFEPPTEQERHHRVTSTASCHG